jgi:hypothetical protein
MNDRNLTQLFSISAARICDRRCDTSGLFLFQEERETLTLALLACGRFNGAKGHFEMTFSLPFPRSTLVAAALALLAALSISPARADRCDDLAGQLKNQIDGLAVGKTAANLIYLSHPQAKQITLGCASRNLANQLFARADSRKPSPAFLNLVAGAAAIIFTLPKDEMLKGATRCIKRMGIIHGDDVSTRYRRLDMRCSRTKTESSITISRGTDQ